MGLINTIHLRKRPHIAAITGDTTDEKTESNAYGEGIATPSDSDTLSLEARNEKEVQQHPDEVTAQADLGVQKAEAAALVWGKKTVYATYAWFVSTDHYSDDAC
jgi:hypothetical protein